MPDFSVEKYTEFLNKHPEYKGVELSNEIILSIMAKDSKVSTSEIAKAKEGSILAKEKLQFVPENDDVSEILGAEFSTRKDEKNSDEDKWYINEPAIKDIQLDKNQMAVMSQFTYKALKKKYKDFDVKMEDNSIAVIDKNTGIRKFFFSKNLANQVVKETYNEHGDVLSIVKINHDGEIDSVKTNYHAPVSYDPNVVPAYLDKPLNAPESDTTISNNIIAMTDLLKSNKHSKEEILSLLQEIPLTSANEFIDQYSSKTGNEFFEDIKNSTVLDEKSKKELLEQFYDIFPFYKNFDKDKRIENTRVENEYYKGSAYDVQYHGFVIVIENKNTGEKSRINMNKLFDGSKDKDKAEMAKLFQSGKIPAEVLADISREVSSVGHHQRKFFDSMAGYYLGDDIKTMIKSGVFVHEVGHAVDSLYDYNGQKYTGFSVNEKFQKTFEAEMNAYTASGKKPFDEDNTKFFSNIGRPYATASNYEMFAECYALLMNGKCGSKSVILEYFPNTLQAVKEGLDEIRNLPDSQRRDTTSQGAVIEVIVN